MERLLEADFISEDLSQASERSFRCRAGAQQRQGPGGFEVSSPAADFEDYESWLKIGMALHSVDEGLLNDWVEWSSSMSTFDEGECLQKWDSLSEKAPGEGVGIGTIGKEAKNHGYKEPVRGIAPPERAGLPGLIETAGSFNQERMRTVNRDQLHG